MSAVEHFPADHEFVPTQSTNVCGHWFATTAQGEFAMCCKYDDDPIHTGAWPMSAVEGADTTVLADALLGEHR